jgi:hypothetical protein
LETECIDKLMPMRRVEPATIDITADPDGIRAWIVALTRI